MFSSNATQVSSAANYIEDVFSTYLYTGNGSTQTITNGIDLSGKGGLVWGKARSSGAYYPYLSDTVRGLNNQLYSNTTDAQNDVGAYLTATSTGYTINNGGGTWNNGGTTYVNWTFRKQAKFFDVVTYTGNATARTIAHNLGSAPGCIMVKCITEATDWWVYHRSLGTNQVIKLNTTAAQDTSSTAWNNTAPTSTVFSIGNNGQVNSNGQTYVAYIFAHDAGGFGLTGTDNVISCGSFTSSSIGLATVDLGYEPQWILYKGSNGVTNWQMVDNMRGFVVGAANAGTSYLNANTSAAEATTPPVGITNTGFNFDGAANITYIYIAIRRGPMKVPTSGTSVFSPVTYTGNGTTNALTGIGFPPDLMITKGRSAGSANEGVTRDRLRGTNPALRTTTTNAESSTTTNGLLSYDMGGVTLGADNTGTDVNGQTNTSGNTYVNWLFRRAPGFFDEVCYTGTGTSTAFNHNLTVVPEMIITKIRNSAVPNWGVWHNALSPSSAMLFLNTTGTQGNGYVDTVTSTTFSFATANGVVNSSGNTYVAYLFASCSGVSKVGSYTGTGTTLQVNCGFTGGARFVLIKRTDSTGAWYVWDSARGIVAGNDPYLLLNSTAAEVTNTDYVDTYSAGFEISSTAPAAINASGGSFIFLAIA